MNQRQQQNIPALILLGSLFFIFGFITWTNSQLIPYLKIACELNDTASYLVATAFFAAYFVMGLPSAAVLRKTGFKNGMSLGLLIMAAGALLFLPAAHARNYPLFLTGLFIIGTGLALLQTASNPYAAILGPMESAAQRISIMGICNKVAGILAVVVFGSIMLKDVDGLKARIAAMTPAARTTELNLMAERVIMPYTWIAISLAALAIVIYFIRLPEVPEETPVTDNGLSAAKTSILQFPHLLLGALAIFCYVGVEVISYDTFTNFGTELGYATATASGFAKFTGYGLLAGYVLSILGIPKVISQQKALLIMTWLSIALVVAAMFTKGHVAVVCFALLGFSNSVMWPAIWPLAIDKLGRFTKTGSALLVMGIAGGAALPPLYSKLSEFIHMDNPKQLAYVILLPCYLYILYYALKGHKTGVAQVQGA
jgi:glucose/galactose transporter